MRSIPRWGRVVADPHEFLIQIRRGRVIRSGQGMSCFKWPWDSVAVVPTSIRKLSFAADQVTLEKVGVEVTGLAVYRIAEPLVAWRMVDASHDALADILRDMLLGATRRIVATLGVEECIAHRKERVAEALMREIAPVLAGQGTTGDGTDQGWGVVLDTIEIQNVRVLSERVFARLQSPFREKLALDALVAHDQVAREEGRLAAETRRRAEQSRRELMAEEEARLEAERRRESEARAHAEALADRAQQAEIARMRLKTEAERDRAAIELEARRHAQEAEIELTRARRTALTDLSEARLTEILLTDTMPALAHAFRGSFDRIQVTTVGGAAGAEPYAVLSAGIDKVLDVVRQARATGTTPVRKG
jgi:flotillin